ncbi:ATP-binding protein [Streptomyces pluripotens]|uniref:ATP-binding protein n=1 Tax=Streptomyces pluripotens TaxID=1355015 RepID=A0A221P170_9ACTN|nr:ATP-binding protein [Streptomyces pluripotens]ARP71756.1 serine/threonine protein kinase [Streptomyces pluripotens]ASN26009.1 ATP-binding protein [Streptomyces pluripotens]
MQPQSPQPRIFYTTSIRLAAVPTAVSCSRMFVRLVLRRWNLLDYTEDAELVVSELVTNAIRATGITNPEPKLHDIQGHHVIGVQLRVLDTSLFVDVWDRSTEEPVIKEPKGDAESGRGLLLVSAMTKQWSVYRPPAGGKVVWAELEIHKAADQMATRARTPLDIPDDSRAPSGPAERMAYTGLLQQVIDGYAHWMQTVSQEPPMSRAPAVEALCGVGGLTT